MNKHAAETFTENVDKQYEMLIKFLGYLLMIKVMAEKPHFKTILYTLQKSGKFY